MMLETLDEGVKQRHGRDVLVGRPVLDTHVLTFEHDVGEFEKRDGTPAVRVVETPIGVLMDEPRHEHHSGMVFRSLCVAPSC